MKFNSRVKYNTPILVGLIVFFFLIFVGRFFQIGILKHVNNQSLGPIGTADVVRSSQQMEHRGSILDRNGEPIAVQATSYSIYVQLKNENQKDNVQDIDHIADTLSQYLPLSKDQIIQQLTTSDQVDVDFGLAGDKITSEVKNAIEHAQLPGVYFRTNTSRHYTDDFFASHLIGIANKDNPEDQWLTGKMGLEQAYNDWLNKKVELIGYDHIVKGHDITVTLDAPVQNYLEDLMQKTYETYAPEEMVAYLVNAKTGDMLAASQRPTFNLNTREGIEQEWRNLLVENTFEPGSTIKILTTAAAYDMGVVQPQDKFKSGSIKLYDTTVKDYNLTGWGEITYDQGLIHSSNVGVARLVEQMGLKQWHNKLEAFGFGKVPNSGLPNENPGTIQFDNPVSDIMSGFGQALLVSPMQLLQAYSMIGNQGRMLKINTVHQIEGQKEVLPTQLNQAIKPETARHILNVMAQTVTDPQGTARDYRHDGVTIAAKTGTAEIADPERGGYLTGPTDYYFSVISFFPAEEPEYMMYIALKRPHNSRYRTGNQMIAEMFHPLVDYLLMK